MLTATTHRGQYQGHCLLRSGVIAATRKYKQATGGHRIGGIHIRPLGGEPAEVTDAYNLFFTTPYFVWGSFIFVLIDEVVIVQGVSLIKT